MAQYIFTMNHVNKIVDNQRVILKDISLSFYPGAKIGVLGLNGSGKSTLLRIMAGVDRQFDGEARPQTGINIGYLPQEPELDPSKTVREVVEEGVASIKNILSEFDNISMKFSDPMSDDEMNALLARQGELQHEIEACSGWDIDRRLDLAADALRLPDWDAKISQLSGGERRRVALCRLLLSNAEMLLLDEPTNHLDAESVAWLQHYLEDFTGTVVAVTHDRYFLDNAAEWILELDRGEGIPYKGNYTAWLEQKEARLAMEEKQETAHQRTIKAELDWVRASPKGRHAKNKARLARFDELNSKEFQKRNETCELYIPPGERLGDLVFECKNLKKSFGDRILIDNLNLLLPKAGVLGVIGPNGAGKSTFLKMITGQEKPDEGEDAQQVGHQEEHRAAGRGGPIVHQESGAQQHGPQPADHDPRPEGDVRVDLPQRRPRTGGGKREREDHCLAGEDGREERHTELRRSNNPIITHRSRHR